MYGMEVGEWDIIMMEEESMRKTIARGRIDQIKQPLR